MYATTRYNFVRLKAAHKISPLEELVGGDLSPSSSQRLTGMDIFKGMCEILIIFNKRFNVASLELSLRVLYQYCNYCVGSN